MRTVIRVSCIDQQLKAVASPLLASGGMNEAVVAFDFCEKWDGFAKTGVFYRDEEDVYYSLLDENDECIIPHEVYDEPGTFYFTVFGDKDSIRRTASTLRYKAYKGVVGDAMKPSDPTPDVYDQIMAKLNGYDGESGGLSDTAEALLLAILRNAVYTSNQKANIEALEAELNKKDDNTGGDTGEEEPHTHSYTSSVTKAATCTTAGIRTFTCSCGHGYTEPIPATGHKYVDGVCSVCGAADPNHSGSGDDEPHEHIYASEVTKAATCTTEGIHTYTCSCGHTYTEPIPATGHNFVDGICTVCGEADPNHVVLTSISATYSGGDVEVETALTDLSGIVVTATYSDGSTQTVTDYTLTGTIAEGSNTITVVYEGKTTTFTVTGYEKHSHSYTSEVTTAATCTTDGVRTYTCSCGDAYTESIPATGHNFVDRVCTVCGAAGAPDPIVNLSLTDVANNVITNRGTGGATYNTTITDKSTNNSCHTSGESGLTLKKNASAVVNYGINKSNPFTICAKVKLDQKSSAKYQMLFWTENDAPSVYIRGDINGETDIKLTGSLGLTAHSAKATIPSGGKTVIFDGETLPQSVEHTYVFIGDLATDTLYLYIDGELMASQPISTLPTSNTIILGDNSGSYSASQITISEVRIWDSAVDINLI